MQIAWRFVEIQAWYMTPMNLCPPGFECDTSGIQRSDTAVWDVSLSRWRSDVLIKWCAVCLALWDPGLCMLGVVQGGPPIVGCGWVVWRILILGHGTLWAEFILSAQCQEHGPSVCFAFRKLTGLFRSVCYSSSWRDGEPAFRILITSQDSALTSELCVLPKPHICCV